MSTRFLFILIAAPLLLVGCGVMPVVPRMNPDIFNGYKVIQGYQKRDTIGHTDPVQREEDLRQCGVRKFFDGALDLNTLYDDMTLDDITPRRISIDNCMEANGYIIVNTVDCTEKGKPTGLCN